MAGLIRAAGGVVHRRFEGSVQVLLVHRPRYDDWSIPKGKCDPGETDEDAARREVLEETGYVCRLGTDLGSTSYVDDRNRPKIVRFWIMDMSSGTFVANDEVDEIAWLNRADALDRVAREGERQVLERAFALLIDGEARR